MFMVTIQLQQMSNSKLRLLSLSTASQLDMELIDNSTELYRVSQEEGTKIVLVFHMSEY